MNFINKQRKINLDIYDKEIILNEYNTISKRNIDYIKSELQKPFFKVPSYKRIMKWGEEIVFYPFTNKLFKIVITNKNDTSIQLHPRKNEAWYPLKKSTIYNGLNWKEVEKNKKVVIPAHSVHCMKKNSIVFEVQDNNLTDYNETIRLFDKCGRKTDREEKYLNYLLPHLKNSIIIKDNKNKLDDKYDIFIFIVDGINKIDNFLFDINQLYYVKKEYIGNLKINGNVVITKAEYYKEKKYENIITN